MRECQLANGIKTTSKKACQLCTFQPKALKAIANEHPQEHHPLEVDHYSILDEP